MGIVYKYVEDLDDTALLMSISGENNIMDKPMVPRAVFIKLSTAKGIKERLAKLFLKQVCFKEQMDGNVKFLIKDNLPLRLYEPFLTALKDRKLDAIVELNNLKEIQETYADLTMGISAWFDEKIWFHGEGRENEYLKLCKDNQTTPRSKLEMPMPIIQMKVLDKAKEQDMVLTSIKGVKPIFTTFAAYDYGGEEMPDLKQMQLEKLTKRLYDISSYQREY